MENSMERSNLMINLKNDSKTIHELLKKNYKFAKNGKFAFFF